MPVAGGGEGGAAPGGGPLGSPRPNATAPSRGTLRANCAPWAFWAPAGIDLVVGDLLRVVDANPRPTTSIVGISKVMREELADLILRARFATLPEGVTVEGECEFWKGELELYSGIPPTVTG